MKKKELLVVKLGGKILDEAETMSEFLSYFGKLDVPVLLVHGGGKQADLLLDQLGIQPKMHQGRRITDSDTLEVVTMVYAGRLNKQIVSKLQATGCNAIGLTGADANVILSEKRKAAEIDYGWAGDIIEVNISLPEYLIGNGMVPVFCALTHDGNGQLLNTNADTIASALAVAFSEKYRTHLCYAFDRKGVMLDLADEDSLIRELDYASYRDLLKSEQIADGMRPKLLNSFQALQQGVASVRIGKPLELIHQTSNYSTLQL